MVIDISYQVQNVHVFSEMISTTSIVPHVGEGRLAGTPNPLRDNSYPGDLTIELARVQTLKSQINQMNSQFVRMLPTELIAEIFTYCLEDVDNSLPLKLGAVCTAFRTIAWSTPHLWATVILNITIPWRISTQAVLLRDWLSRSGRLPLSIYLCSSQNVHYKFAQLILKVVTEFSDRWRRFDIRLPSSCYQHLPPFDQRLPMLRSLTLKTPDGQNRSHRFDIGNSPQLNHINLKSVYLRSIKFTWHTLTSLELEDFYIDESLEILRQAPNLVSLDIRQIRRGEDAHSMPTEPIVMPALNSLTFVDKKATGPGKILDKVTTPSLRKFSFTADGITHAPYTHLLNLIKRSACSLEIVSLTRCSFPPTQLKQLLAMIPSLTHLHLDMLPSTVYSSHPELAPLTDEILQLCNPTFAFANKNPCLLPNLEGLTYSGPQAFSWFQLVQMVQSRVAGHLLFAEEVATPTSCAASGGMRVCV